MKFQLARLFTCLICLSGCGIVPSGPIQQQGNAPVQDPLRQQSVARAGDALQEVSARLLPLVFRSLDQDHNGFLTGPEYYPGQTSFGRIDQNQDGRLSLSEATAVADFAYALIISPERLRWAAQMGIAEIDADRDGLLSKPEFIEWINHEGKNPPGPVAPLPRQLDPALLALFRRLIKYDFVTRFNLHDSNRDDRLNPAEYEQLHAWGLLSYYEYEELDPKP